MELSLATAWRVHATLARSRANGPGSRFVVWTQGCSLACPGCFNPQTHTAVGATRQVGSVVREALTTTGIDGVTVTGGEPLEQPAALAVFAGEISRAGLGVVVITGFSREEIESDPGLSAAVSDVDMLVAGRYNQRLRVAAGLRGSSNKVYWARSDRYTEEMFMEVPQAEVLIGPDGTVTLTGMVAHLGEERR
ncbi:radical SAM protein [Rhizocola hellebori]|uniref:Anaerobic ribonucleoside-triphosphate reductase-activating protein n=1 Tax=Rhizocola hellebori TaxID=1392758 RepID=A0A8J3VIQ0_9ACTN|nr:4Fe-4S single cluster domain-containing protein [Rhizocola hellebori]GIH07153.1 radical SAM protein [Rhizocola hellebori]